ncbi:DUF2254 family protein [Methanococcus maripaludis]|uniref:Uncharacterized protein n=1 Tax=Methanococcus maripaludis TaxID=39152 RepID=A0A7J9PDI4_METMI|nr:DUF2254 family protein [Methanococcus maripaludis]MBA2860854.1 hypothetical protein [Methanococcus maripaludis]
MNLKNIANYSKELVGEWLKYLSNKSFLSLNIVLIIAIFVKNHFNSFNVIQIYLCLFLIETIVIMTITQSKTKTLVVKTFKKLKGFIPRLKRKLKSINYGYIIAMLISIIVSFMLLNLMYKSGKVYPVDLNNTSAITNFNDNSRYFLSTIAQTQGALGGILISLVMVAVQLSSQSHSIKTLNIFLKSTSLWAFLTIYVVSILYSITMLMIIPQTGYFEPILGIFDQGILLAIQMILLIISILVTLYYIQDSISMLNTETMFSKTLESIYTKNSSKKDRMNNLNVIYNIVIKSIELGESFTAIGFINVLYSKYPQIYKKNDKQFLNVFSDKILGIGTNGFNKNHMISISALNLLFKILKTRENKDHELTLIKNLVKYCINYYPGEYGLHGENEVVNKFYGHIKKISKNENEQFKNDLNNSYNTIKQIHNKRSQT